MHRTETGRRYNGIVQNATLEQPRQGEGVRITNNTNRLVVRGTMQMSNSNPRASIVSTTIRLKINEHVSQLSHDDYSLSRVVLIDS